MNIFDVIKIKNFFSVKDLFAKKEKKATNEKNICNHVYDKLTSIMNGKLSKLSGKKPSNPIRISKKYEDTLKRI